MTRRDRFRGDSVGDMRNDTKKGAKVLSIMVAALFAISAFAVVFSAADADNEDNAILGEGGDIIRQANFGWGSYGHVEFFDVVPYGAGFLAVGYADENALTNMEKDSDIQLLTDGPKGGYDAIIVYFAYYVGQGTDRVLQPIWCYNFGGPSYDMFYGAALAVTELNGQTMAKLVAVGCSDENSFYDYGDWLEAGMEGYGYGALDAMVVVFDLIELCVYGTPVNFGGPGEDVFYDVVVTPDGDVIAVGYSDEYSFDGGYWREMDIEGYGGLDAIILAFGFDGGSLYGWPITGTNFGGEGDDEFYGVALMSREDGGFYAMAVGYSDAGSFTGSAGNWVDIGIGGYGGYDAIVVAFSEEGVVAAVNFGGAGDDIFRDLVIGTDELGGGMVFAVGYTHYSSIVDPNGSWSQWREWSVSQEPVAWGGYDGMLVVFGDWGTVIGAVNLGGEGDDFLYGVDKDPTGAIYAVGESAPLSFGSGDMPDLEGKGDYDAIAFAVNETGVQGVMNYGGADEDWFRAVAFLPETGSVVVVGGSSHYTFGTGDWEDFEAFGNLDGVIMVIDAGVVKECDCPLCDVCGGCLLPDCNCTLCVPCTGNHGTVDNNDNTGGNAGSGDGGILSKWWFWLIIVVIIICVISYYYYSTKKKKLL